MESSLNKNLNMQDNNQSEGGIIFPHHSSNAYPIGQGIILPITPKGKFFEDPIFKDVREPFKAAMKNNKTGEAAEIFQSDQNQFKVCIFLI